SLPADSIRASLEREQRFELSRRPQHGPPLTLSASLRRIVGGLGAVTDLVVSFRDVTAERAEARLKDDFISLGSHKLLTPLTIVSGNLELFTDGTLGSLSADQKIALGDMSEGLGELRRVVERLIQFATLGSQESRLRPVRLSFRDLSAAVSEAAGRAAAAR